MIPVGIQRFPPRSGMIRINYLTGIVFQILLTMAAGTPLPAEAATVS